MTRDQQTRENRRAETVSIVKPLEGLRYVQIKDKAGRRWLAPISENAFRGVQHAEAVARHALRHMQGGDPTP